MLAKGGFPDDTPIIRGSALKALESQSENIDQPEYQPILALMKALDNYVPAPERAIDKPFLLPIEDVFNIKGRGTVITGKIEQGIIYLQDEIEIVGMAQPTRRSVCIGIDIYKQTLDSAQAGDNIGILLHGIERADVQRGQILARPDTLKAHTRFKAQVYLALEKDGQIASFSNNDSLRFYFHTAAITGTITLPKGTEKVSSNEMAEIEIETGYSGSTRSWLAVRYS